MSKLSVMLHGQTGTASESVVIIRMMLMERTSTESYMRTRVRRSREMVEAGSTVLNKWKFIPSMEVYFVFALNRIILFSFEYSQTRWKSMPPFRVGTARSNEIRTRRKSGKPCWREILTNVTHKFLRQRRCHQYSTLLPFRAFLLRSVPFHPIQTRFLAIFCLFGSVCRIAKCACVWFLFRVCVTHAFSIHLPVCQSNLKYEHSSRRSDREQIHICGQKRERESERERLSGKLKQAHQFHARSRLKCARSGNRDIWMCKSWQLTSVCVSVPLCFGHGFLSPGLINAIT